MLVSFVSTYEYVCKVSFDGLIEFDYKVNPQSPVNRNKCKYQSANYRPPNAVTRQQVTQLPFRFLFARKIGPFKVTDILLHFSVPFMQNKRTYYIVIITSRKLKCHAFCNNRAQGNVAYRNVMLHVLIMPSVITGFEHVSPRSREYRVIYYSELLHITADHKMQCQCNGAHAATMGSVTGSNKCQILKPVSRVVALRCRANSAA